MIIMSLNSYNKLKQPKDIRFLSLINTDRDIK